MTHRTFDEQIANFNRVVSSWDINQEYKVALLGMIVSLGYEHEKSITPEPHWIPVTERLPKKSGTYTVTDHKGDVVRFVFIVGSDSSRKYWYRCAKAWMPLPEPFKGVTDGRD